MDTPPVTQPKSQAQSQAQSQAAGWKAMVLERFPPGAYGPMVVLFTLGNGVVGARAAGVAIAWGHMALAMALALSFFFRLRLFDEIKDYEVDLDINPTRPLARGALSIPQVLRGVYVLTAFEFAIACAHSPTLLVAHGVAVIYSYLMYKEFFIGSLLRPHLTTYALTHTAVSILLGYSLATALGHAYAFALPGVLGFGLVNWGLFNVFEFARKTYAPEEERPTVDSYSSLFGPRGAALLTLSQVAQAVLAWGLLCAPAFVGQTDLVAQGGLALVVTGVPAAAYVASPTKRRAKVFRDLAGLYLLLFFGLLLWTLR